MPRDPVLAAHEQADGPSRAWFAAIDSYVMIDTPTLAEVQALGVVAQYAWADVLTAALAQPDEGSGERYI